ncbi:MAG: hypothetical protein GY868_02345 [Deltaproteobacteria bacterium]|nr:hypothetical protein [Deltaproteobacteria bacterium]
MDNRMGFSAKIYTGFVLLIMIINVLTCIILRNLTLVKQDTAALKSATSSAMLLSDAEAALQKQRGDLFMMRLAGKKIPEKSNSTPEALDAFRLFVKSQTAEPEQDQLKRLVAGFERALAAYEPLRADFVSGGAAMQQSAGDDTALKMTTAFEAVFDPMQQLNSFYKQRAEAVQKSLLGRFAVIQWTVGMLTVFGILIGVTLIVYLQGYVMKPVRRVIGGLNIGADHSIGATRDMAESTKHIADGAAQNAASLEEMSAEIKELAVTSRETAENTHTVTDILQSTRNSAEGSKKAILRLDEAIRRIKTSSEETEKIMKTIDEIAFQTNLLALNAAVEAARAGEAGRGFAVVAEEVRNLAQRSAEAAKNTAVLIEDSQKSAENGVEVSREVEQISKDIIESVEKVSVIMETVSGVNDTQSQGIDQISANVSQMEQHTQTSAASSQELVATSSELSSRAQEVKNNVTVLVGIVGNFDTVAVSDPISAKTPSGGSDKRFSLSRIREFLPLGS